MAEHGFTDQHKAIKDFTRPEPAPGKRRKIGHGMGSPGGPHTPGAKQARAKKAAAAKRKRGTSKGK